MRIRQEQPSDYDAIYTMVKTAFESAKVKDGDEQDFVNRLRAGNKYIRELALIAEEDDNIVGHIMLTKTSVKQESSQSFTALLLAPLCVALEYRSHGIGAQLVHTALNMGREMGYTAVFIAGDPAYYGRFGFTPTKNYGIRCTLDIPEEMTDCIMLCELTPKALHGVSGMVDFDG